MLQKGLIENLFLLSPFTTLKQLNESYAVLSGIYKETMPSLIFSTDKDCKVTNEELTNISTLIGAVITNAMVAHTDEVNKGGKRKNVIDSLILAKQHLTVFRELINEAKTK